MEKWSGEKGAALSIWDNLSSKNVVSWWMSPGYTRTGLVLGGIIGLLLCACLYRKNASERQVPSFMILKKEDRIKAFPQIISKTGHFSHK